MKQGINVIRYSNDTKKINKAHHVLAWIYIHMKDYDNAREHVNVLPALEGHCIREDINMSLMFFEKGFDSMKDSAIEFGKRLFEVTIHMINTLTTHYCYFGTLEEAIEICDWSESVINSYTRKSDFTTESYIWVLRKLNFSKMSAYLRAGEDEKAKEVCDAYLNEIKENGTFTDDEYKAVEKEFREKIYIL